VAQLVQDDVLTVDLSTFRLVEDDVTLRQGDP